MDNTPYDDVFRTLLTDCTELMIPVVNEIFHTKYTGKETICLLQNEHFIKMPDGSEQERITDSSFEIISSEETSIPQVLKNQLYGGSAGCNTAQRKRYHIECQSTEDGTMIVRMFEYDTQLALENRALTSNTLTVQFPDSAIVSLRHTKNTPEEMTVKVLTPGGRVSYTVPVLKVKRYTIHELFEKKLFFLIPFHIFAYEKDFKELEENKKKLKQLEAEYASIRERLEIACQMGDLNRYAKAAILDMSRKVIEHIAVKYKNVAKGVSRTMGGKVLNYEAKDILNRGRAEGRMEGRREGEEYTKIQIATKLLNMGNDIKSVAELAELPQETVEKLAQSISKEEKQASGETALSNGSKALLLSFQVGADTTSENKTSVTMDSMSAKSIGVDGIQVTGSDSTNADKAVDTISDAIKKVSKQRSALGAVQNRLEHTISNLDNVVENTTSAESRIRDTDMAEEMVSYSKNNILMQAGQSMLAQANQQNQGVLSLLQ